MKKYCIIANKEENSVNIVEGDLIEILGAKKMDVEQAWNGQWYLKGYAPEKPEETLQEKLNRLEVEYQMNRWQREAILVEGSPYSDFTKTRARELEDIAEQIRKG